MCCIFYDCNPHASQRFILTIDAARLRHSYVDAQQPINLHLVHSENTGFQTYCQCITWFKIPKLGFLFRMQWNLHSSKKGCINQFLLYTKLFNSLWPIFCRQVSQALALYNVSLTFAKSSLRIIKKILSFQNKTLKNTFCNTMLMVLRCD